MGKEGRELHGRSAPSELILDRKVMHVSNQKVRVRKTPSAMHLYTATMKGSKGVYGWGDTPRQAREKLAELMAKLAAGTL